MIDEFFRGYVENLTERLGLSKETLDYLLKTASVESKDVQDAVNDTFCFLTAIRSKPGWGPAG